MNRAIASLGLVAALTIAAIPAGGIAQSEDEETEQLLIDLDALVIGTQVTTRCAFYDTTLAYLTPLEAKGAELRLRQIEASLAAVIEDLPEQMADMRAEANAIACGAQGLEPFLEFNRQIARDVIDIALVAWQTIEIDPCVYFADDEFMASVSRAKSTAPTPSADGDPTRAAYIEENARAWVALFAENCLNLNFEPAQTLPGEIALALPIE